MPTPSPVMDDFPDLLKRFLAAKLQHAGYTAIITNNKITKRKPCTAKANDVSNKRPAPADTIDDATEQNIRDATLKRIRFSFSEQITFTEPLRGDLQLTQKEIADSLAIGGLRNTAASVGRLHMVTEFGAKLGYKLRELITTNSDHHTAAGTDEQSWVNITCASIGSADVVPPPSAVAAVKALLIEMTAMTLTDAERAMPALTLVDAHLLEAWRRIAADPDHEIFKWFRDGAPAGIKQPILDPGIFPSVDKPAETEPEHLQCNSRQFKNYPGVEEDQITDSELAAHLEKGHLAAFDTYDEMRHYVDANYPPILSKLGLIKKIKNGIMKARMILDTKESGVKTITGQFQRVILPRLFDAILQILYVLCLVLDADLEGIEAFVLDFSDAFWQIPIAAEEQKYFCCTGLIHGRRKWVVFLRAAQGSAAGPTLWNRVAALVMRLTQSLFNVNEVRLVCYVDDPLAAIRGTEPDRKLFTAIMVLVWMALGFTLAFAKGQRGKLVTWIGGTLQIESDGVRAWVKQSIVDDIRSMITTFLRGNLISKKELHSFIGKVNHAAGLLIVLRPFMDPLWAAWVSKAPDAHPGVIWTKQIITELHWFDTFFAGNGARIERFFSVDAYRRSGTIVEIGTDASPWGLGGWLKINGIYTEYFASRLTEADSKKFDTPLALCKGQQVWEALAVLVAVVLWSSSWTQDRVILKVKSDNVTALTMLTKLRTKPGSPALAVIARELALRLVDLSFPPDAEHVAGAGHVSADALSRVYDPRKGKGYLTSDLHPAMRRAKEATAPTRDATFYRL